MVGTIAPLVQVARRQWLVSTGIFLATSVLGGGLFGVALGSLGWFVCGRIPPHLVTWLLATCAVVLALVDMQILPFAVPTSFRSVPQSWWMRYGPFKAAFAYGGILGMGVTTFIPFASFYFIPVADLLLGPLLGGIIGAGYGLGRALAVPIASIAIVGGVKPEAIGHAIVGAGRLRQLAKRLNGLGLLLVAVGLIVWT